MIKAKVFVSFKPSIFDPESKVITNTLMALGYFNVNDVKKNKYFEIIFNETDHTKVEKQLTDMCQTVLVNPNTENFRYELENINEQN